MSQEASAPLMFSPACGAEPPLALMLHSSQSGTTQSIASVARSIRSHRPAHLSRYVGRLVSSGPPDSNLR